MDEFTDLAEEELVSIVEEQQERIQELEEALRESIENTMFGRLGHGAEGGVYTIQVSEKTVARWRKVLGK